MVNLLLFDNSFLIYVIISALATETARFEIRKMQKNFFSSGISLCVFYIFLLSRI